jgi:hypothetical protein
VLRDLDATADASPDVAAVPVGTVTLSVPSPPVPTDISEVTWTLSSSTAGMVANGMGWTAAPFSIGAFAAGAGYAIIVTASDDGGATCIGGTGTFTVVAGQSVLETAGLECTWSGSGLVLASPPSPCGVWDSVDAIPSYDGVVGDVLSIVTTATGADAEALEYVWTVSNPAVGHVLDGGPGDAGPTSNVTPFVCDSAGSTALSLLVLDGMLAGDASCASLSSDSITIVCEAPAEASPPDASDALDAPDALPDALEDAP